MWSSVSKFGLKYYDFPTLVWNVSSMLRLLALNIDPRNKNPINIFIYLKFLIICVSYYYVYLISMAWFVFVRCRETGDLLAAIIVFSLGVSSEISMMKLICVFLNRKKMTKIIAEYLACDANVIQDSRFGKNIMGTLRVVKKRAFIVWMVIIWNGIIYVFKPLFTPGRHFMEDIFIFYGLEPMTESPNYEIALTMNIIGVYVTCFPAANVTALFIIINGYTEAQMLALSNEVRNLWADALKYRDTLVSESQEISSYNADLRHKIEMNKYITNKLHEILRVHTTNINLLRQIEGVFKGAIAIEFMLLTVGIIAELLGGLEKTWIELPFALMLVGTDCFTGQRIIDASLVFEKAVYDSKWENFDVANRKIILLMLQNSQKAMKLSAGGVATLSLECLMAVWRMTYSAYTTLRSTMNHV